MLAAFLFLTACTVHRSSVREAPEAAGLVGDVGRAQADCGWTTIEETRTTKFLGLPLGTWTRPYDQALYYCCPEPGGIPVCRQADWYSTAPAAQADASLPPESRPQVVLAPTPPPVAALTDAVGVTALAYLLLEREPDRSSAAWAADLSFVSQMMASGHSQDDILQAVQLGVQLMGPGRDLPAIITAGLKAGAR